MYQVRDQSYVNRLRVVPTSLASTKIPINGGYDKLPARLSNNSLISSREFDLGEPAR